MRSFAICRRRQIRGCAPWQVARSAAIRCAMRSQALAAARMTGCWCMTRPGPASPRADLDALIAAVAEDAVGGLLAVPLADTLKQGR